MIQRRHHRSGGATRLSVLDKREYKNNKNLECERGHKAEERCTGAHLHPMQLRIVVGLSEASKHEVIRILEERACAKACWSKHGGVQRTRRLVGMSVGVRWLLVLLLRWRRRRGRWQVFSCLVDNAQLDDGGWVDWTTIGCFWGG